jgi:hypothetical protein
MQKSGYALEHSRAGSVAVGGKGGTGVFVGSDRGVFEGIRVAVGGGGEGVLAGSVESGGGVFVPTVGDGSGVAG